MADKNRQLLNELLQRPGNNICADCKSGDSVTWASCNLGVFLCPNCAGIHRGLGTDISRVKSVILDNWDDDKVQTIGALGNEIVNTKYEQHMPLYYKRPTKDDVSVLKEQFIHAKYERKEFQYPDKQLPYSSNKKEGFLMKRGKKDKSFRERRFVINSQENTMAYYKSKTTPKATLRLDDANMVFVPEKVGHPNGMQISYMQDNGPTRNLFVYCSDAKEAVDWYMALRSAKLDRRRLAFPDRDQEELCKDLTQDFLCEGYLEKKGPNNEPYKRRWFTLDRRKMMYFDDPLSASPIKEFYIGHRDARNSVGNSINSKSSNCEFCLETQERTFELKAECFDDRVRWITAFQKVIDTPPTPQDTRSNVHADFVTEEMKKATLSWESHYVAICPARFVIGWLYTRHHLSRGIIGLAVFAFPHLVDVYFVKLLAYFYSLTEK